MKRNEAIFNDNGQATDFFSNHLIFGQEMSSTFCYI